MDLLYPFILVISLSICSVLIIPKGPLQTITVESEPAEVMDINIYVGERRIHLSVSSQITPQQISEIIYSSQELINKTPTFVCNGRRLNNDVPIHRQRVHNQSFLHARLMDFVEIPQSQEANVPFLPICCIILSIFWCLYFSYPKHYSFISKTILIAFTELVSIFIYKALK